MKWLNSREVTNEMTGFLYLWQSHKIRRSIFDIWIWNTYFLGFFSILNLKTWYRKFYNLKIFKKNEKKIRSQRIILFDFFEYVQSFWVIYVDAPFQKTEM